MSVIISIFQLKSESSWRDWDPRSAALEKESFEFYQRYRL